MFVVKHKAEVQKWCQTVCFSGIWFGFVHVIRKYIRSYRRDTYTEIIIRNNQLKVLYINVRQTQVKDRTDRRGRKYIGGIQLNNKAQTFNKHTRGQWEDQYNIFYYGYTKTISFKNITSFISSISYNKL